MTRLRVAHPRAEKISNRRATEPEQRADSATGLKRARARRTVGRWRPESGAGAAGCLCRLGADTSNGIMLRGSGLRGPARDDAQSDFLLLAAVRHWPVLRGVRVGAVFFWPGRVSDHAPCRGSPGAHRRRVRTTCRLYMRSFVGLMNAVGVLSFEFEGAERPRPARADHPRESSVAHRRGVPDRLHAADLASSRARCFITVITRWPVTARPAM